MFSREYTIPSNKYYLFFPRKVGVCEEKEFFTMAVKERI